MLVDADLTCVPGCGLASGLGWLLPSLHAGITQASAHGLVLLPQWLPTGGVAPAIAKRLCGIVPAIAQGLCGVAPAIAQRLCGVALRLVVLPQQLMADAALYYGSYWCLQLGAAP